MAARKKTSKKPKRTKAKTDDIVQLILADHKPLKEMIKTLKDPKAEFEELRECYEEFAPMLIAHAKPEEAVLYVEMKGEKDLRREGFEGEIEHSLADQLIEDIEQTDDEDLWTARVKVLAEIVEHHIKEEESRILPDYKRNSNSSERSELGQQYLSRKAQYMPEKFDRIAEEFHYPSQLHH